MKEEERYCGNCCWFHGEMTDGEGLCVDTNYPMDCVYCDTDACKDFVSRKEMRHHMAVLLQSKRFSDCARKVKVVEFNIRRAPKKHDIDMAIAFAYKYMKLFSKL